jgi:hypothetical protein
MGFILRFFEDSTDFIFRAEVWKISMALGEESGKGD